MNGVRRSYRLMGRDFSRFVVNGGTIELSYVMFGAFDRFMTECGYRGGGNMISRPRRGFAEDGWGSFRISSDDLKQSFNIKDLFRYARITPLFSRTNRWFTDEFFIDLSQALFIVGVKAFDTAPVYMVVEFGGLEMIVAGLKSFMREREVWG